MADDTTTVTDTVVPVGSKVRGKNAKKANVKNAKNPKEAVSKSKVKVKSNDKTIATVVDLMHMAAQQSRAMILLNLANGPLNVTGLTNLIDQSQPATSHHICLLRTAGMIESERDGKSNYYSLTEKGTAAANGFRFMMENLA